MEFVTAELQKLSTTLIREAAGLGEEASRVEWIERELRLIQASLQRDARRVHGREEDFNQLAVIARDAEEFIETFVTKRARWWSAFSLMDRFKLGRELERISSRVRAFSEERMKYVQPHQTTNIEVVVAERSEDAASCAVEKLSLEDAASCAVEKLSLLLSLNFVTSAVKKIVEEVRDEVVSMQNVVSNLKSKDQLNEREMVWLEEVNDVCNCTVSVVGVFITRIRRLERLGFPSWMSWLEQHRLPFGTNVGAPKLMEEMENIKTQLGGALRRRLTYGVGEEDVGGPISMLPAFSLENLIIPVSTPIDFNLLFAGPVGKALVSIRRDLALMRAFIRDAESPEGLNGRQRIWLQQISAATSQAAALLDGHERRMKRYEGVFTRFFLLPYLDPLPTNHLLYKMHYIWERKTIYDIANINGRSTQGSGSEIHNEVERYYNSGTKVPAPVVTLFLLALPRLKNLAEQVESIQEEFQLIEALAEDVVVGELDPISKIWVEQMTDVAREIKSVSDQYNSKFECKPIHIQIFNYWAVHDIIQVRVDEIRNKIQDALRRKRAYGLVHLQTQAESSAVVQRLRPRTQPSLNNEESSIIGFDEDVQVLLAQLLAAEEHRCIISIIGIEGTGKTTLAKLIFDNNAVKDHFHYRVWVSPTQDSVAVEDNLLLEDIAKQIMTGQEHRWTTEDLTQALKTYMENKRYLIVVDGIQTFQVLDTLKRTIPDMSTGCRLLLTSRNANLDPLAGPRTFVHQPQFLDDENSLVLLRNNLDKNIPPEIMKDVEETVIKCEGLRSDILKIRDLLSQKDVTKEELSSMMEQLNQDRKQRWSETLDTINMNLTLSLRRCLSYFELFPAQFEIPARRLITLWVAEGLVHQGEFREPPEQVAEKNLTELIYLNMVQIAKRKRNGKVKTCRLPNALRELWFTKATRSASLQGHMGTSSHLVPKKLVIRQVADHLDESDTCHDHIHSDTITASASLRTSYKDVFSFLSFDTREGSKPGQEIGDFLDRCISIGCFLLLRVLDLERVYKPKLPKNIARLSQLRYLGLRWTYLESLPSSVSSLLKLQTLDLKHTYINILTHSIWKMQLRHLFLSETYRSRFPPRPTGNSLSDLQTLWGLFVNEETPVKGGLDRLVNIKKLGLTCQSMSLDEGEMTSQLDAIAEWILKLKYLQSLRLKSRDKEGRPCNIHFKSLANHTYLTDIYLLGILNTSPMKSLFPLSLIELTLSHSELQEDPMQILGEFPFLRSLCLLAGSYKGETLTCKKRSFPQLYVLKFWMLEQLAEWNIEEDALPRLRQLELRSCACLKVLPDGLRQVNTLLELKLTNMQEFEVDRRKIPSKCSLWRDDSP